MSDYHKADTSPPNVEQVSEYRRTTNRGSQPQPPAAATALKGTTTRQGIEEAASARRQQSASWTNRDTGPTTPGSANHK
jgi:hypothetical protein